MNDAEQQAGAEHLVEHLRRELAGPPPLAPRLLRTVLAETLGWCRDWRHDQLPDEPARQAADVNAGSFRVWHVPVGSRGLAALQNFAVAQVQGDVHHAHDLVQDSWTGVFEMLAAVVDRTRQGQSLADFRLPADRPNADNVASYLRTRVIWLRNRRHRDGARLSSLEEREMDLHESPRAPEREEGGGPGFSLALRFASLWFLVDSRPEERRWLAMVLHALGIPAPDFDPSGGRRNDPGRAEARLLARLHVCLGLAPWMKRWATFQPRGYWDGFSHPMPREITADLPLAAVEDALARIRPALESAASACPDLCEARRRALVAVLVKNRHVEGQVAAFEGNDAEDRTMALFRAAERLGRGACDVLEGRPAGGAGGWGPPCGHGSERERMLALARGGVPTPAQLQAQGALLARCEPCRDWYQGVCEAVQHAPGAARIGAALRVPAARRSQAVRGWAWVPIAAAAAVLLWVGRPDDPTRRPKGEAVVEPVVLQAAALPPGPDARPQLAAAGSRWPAGTTLTFQVDAAAAGVVYLLHRHPDGRVERLLPAQGERPVGVGAEPSLVQGQHGAPLALVLPEEVGEHQVLVLVLPEGATVAADWTRVPAQDVHLALPAWQSWSEANDLPDLQVGLTWVFVE